MSRIIFDAPRGHFFRSHAATITFDENTFKPQERATTISSSVCEERDVEFLVAIAIHS
jgi:hypothetical protein